MSFTDFSSKIVLDPGSCYSKVGFSHDDNPRMVITSFVEEQYTESSSPYQPRTYATKSLSPMKRGFVTDWDRMEKLYTQMLYNELNLEGQVQNYPGMIMVENMCNTRRAREKTAELMFDKFGVNSLCMYSAPLLSLLASSSAHKKQMYSGVVVELGFGNSFVVPVDNFTVYSDAWAEIAYGGHHITNHLTELLSKRPGNTGSGDYKSSESAKTEYACVSQNLAFEPDNLIRLPNGQLLGKERFACTEALFAENGFGLPQNIVNLTEKACHDSALKHKDLIKQNVINGMAIRENLCSNIVLSGYTATIPGLCTRLQSELAKVPFYPSSLFKPSLPCPVAEACGAWKGAALMANMDAFAHLWVSRAEFEDAGMQILFKKWLPVNTLK